MKLALVLLLAAPAFAGAQATATRTPDRHPDLQGIWLHDAATPLERPKALEGRQFLTDEEVAELKRRADRLFGDGTADNPGGGDAVFLAALNNLDQFKSRGSTGLAGESIPRTFENRTSLIVDPADGRIPAMTEEGRRRQAAFAASKLPPSAAGPEALAPDIRCITFGVPRVGGNYGAGTFGYYQIVQTPSYIVIVTEAIHDARIVPLDGRPHLPPSVRLWNGDSRGRWEGNTLIVDTTNFSGRNVFMGSAGNLHLVERFTRVSADMLEYRVTLDDPTTWTKPWTAVLNLRRTDEKMYEYACHDGNYDVMRDILLGARATEKQ